MPSDLRRRLHRFARGAALISLSAVVAYSVSPARADAPPGPSEQVPRQLAFGGYAERDGQPIDGVKRVRHVIWRNATSWEYADALFMEEKDERFTGGRYTATLGECHQTFVSCTTGTGTAADFATVIAGLNKVYVSTQVCTAPLQNSRCPLGSWIGVVEPVEVSTSMFGLATPSQRLIGVWQSVPEVACAVAGPLATAIPQLRVTLNLPQTSRLEISYAVSAKWRTGLNTGTSGLRVGVGPASQSTDWSSGSPRIVWSVADWPQSRVGRAAIELNRRVSSVPATGAFASHSFSVGGVPAGSQTIMVTANTVGTGDGEVDICGRGSGDRAMAEDSVLTILAFAE